MKKFVIAWLTSLLAPVLVVFRMVQSEAYSKEYFLDEVIATACIFGVTWIAILILGLIFKNKYSWWRYFLIPLVILGLFYAFLFYSASVLNNLF